MQFVTTQSIFQFHSLTDSPIYCSKSIVTRLAYIVCDNCCSYLSIELIPGLHIPDNAKVPASRPGTAASINYSIPVSCSCKLASMDTFIETNNLSG